MVADRNGVHLHRLTCTPGFLFLLSLVVSVGMSSLLWLSLLSALLHELGHLAACLALGVPVLRFRLTACGGILETGRRLSCGQELLVALSGPAVNLLLSAALLPLVERGAFSVFLGVNLMLGLFNLLPMLPLDGGRALHSLLSLAVGENAAEWFLALLSRLMLGGLWGMALLLALLGNASLLVVAIALSVKEESGKTLVNRGRIG